MRYRIGTLPGESGTASTDHMLLFTVVIGLLIGLVLVFLGRQGRQLWLVFWGGTLVVAALIYLGATVLGYT